jgi:hypothetical protein
LRRIDGWRKITIVLSQQASVAGMVIFRAAIAAVVTVGILAAPLAVEAQPAEKVWRIGFLRGSAPPVINARTAQALGLTLPPSLVLRADSLIE